MENIEIAYKTILTFLSAIVVIGGATAVFTRWFSPFKTLKENVENKVNKSDFDALKNQVDRLTNFQDIDHDRLKVMETGNEKICKCILAITDHELTGNSVDKLRKAKDEMQEYLITK